MRLNKFILGFLCFITITASFAQPTSNTTPTPPVTTVTTTIPPTSTTTTTTNVTTPTPTTTTTQPIVEPKITVKVSSDTATPPPQVNATTVHTVKPSQSNVISELRSMNAGSSNKISLKFQNIELRSLIQLIAKISGQNFIISDAVKGSTTIGLTDVTWQQALDTVMQSNGLAYKTIGKTIFISTLDDIIAKRSKELTSAAEIANLLPLRTTLVRLKYANGEALAKTLKGTTGTLLTARGEIAVDSATNSLIIRDVRTNLIDIVNFIHKLDKPARQVEIEARIVDMDIRYEAQLGVRFGLSDSRSVSGTWNGASQLAAGTSVAHVNPIDQRLNFNIPASVLSTNVTPASIGLALAHLGPVLLDLELSALEEEGHSRIISRPRVITANQTKATIQTGEEIPYQQATSSGATSVDFKKAVLSLEIVPQITPDNKIILKVKATQDSRGQQLLVSQQTTSGGGTSTTTTSGVIIPATFGPPTINTEQVESNVLLKNNETLVIGGIFKLDKSNTLDRVPFFSDLPFIGNLFKHRAIRNERKELLFFITPHIIETPNSYINAKGEGERMLG